MNRWISNIIWWWQTRHQPLARLPEWKQASEAERRAKATGCTQAIGRARKAKYQAVHAALTRKAV
jgi:hypothetical protein